MRASGFTRPAGALLVLLVLFAQVANAADDPGFEPGKAKDAYEKLQIELRRAEEQYESKVRAARMTYRDALVPAKAAAVKANRAEEAEKIDAEIKSVEEEEPAPVKRAAQGPVAVKAARYGGPEKWVDVTEAVKKFAVGGRLRFPSLGNMHDILKVDPSPGKPKSLELIVLLHGREWRLSLGGADNPTHIEPAK